MRRRKLEKAQDSPEQRPSSLRPRDVLTLWVFKRCSQLQISVWNFHTLSSTRKSSTGHYFQVSLHSHVYYVSVSISTSFLTMRHLLKLDYGDIFCFPINTEHQFTFTVTQWRYFFPHKGSLYTETVGLCCQFCSLVPLRKDSINRHKNQMLCFTLHFL